MTRLIAYPDPANPNLDLQAEAEAMAEVIGALRHVSEWLPKIKGATNRVCVSFALPRIEAQLERERRNLARITESAHRNAEHYKAEAVGILVKAALGIRWQEHVERLKLQQRADTENRLTQRAHQSPIFRDPSLGSELRRPLSQNTSDESLIAAVRSGKYRSITGIAIAVGLTGPTAWRRLAALVRSGQLADSEIPRGGVRRRECAHAD
ncbi:MAG: hypothetical protein Q7J29_12950 [Stagnimonas sp.]|nr:hypothetical protein [Stagnimonas sp.]